MSGFNAIWKRVVESTDLKTLTDLADLVGSTQPHISRKKKQDEFSVEWAYKISLKYGVHTDWLMRGIEPKDIGQICPNERNFVILDELDIWLKEVVVNEPYRRDWFYASILDAFPMFKEWKKRRDQASWKEDSPPDSKIA